MDESNGFIFYHVTDYNICNIINMTCSWNNTFNNRTRETTTKILNFKPLNSRELNNKERQSKLYT
jgi:hypothetical protein